MRLKVVGSVLKAALIGCLGCIGFGAAHAQDAGDIKQTILSKESLPALSGQSFGEQVNTMTGALTFSAEDIHLKGIGPDIVVHRSTNPGPRIKTTSAFGNWSFDFPSIEVHIGYPMLQGVPPTPGDYWMISQTGSTQYNRCTSTPFPTVYNAYDEFGWIYDGITVNDGQSSSQLIRRGAENSVAPSGQTTIYPYVANRGDWQISCLSSTSNGEKGEAFLATGPDGTKYYLDNLMGYSIPQFSYLDSATGERVKVNSMRIVMGVSRIVDRFGNWVAYHYNGNQISSIDASDGRLVQFTYDATTSVISQIVVQPNSPYSRTWQYQYAAATGLGNKIDSGYDADLSRVVLPDGSTWEYSSIQSIDWGYQFAASCPRTGDSAAYAPDFTSTVKAPSGATATFAMSAVSHGRSYVPTICEAVLGGGHTDQIATVFQSYSLVQKTISGVGIPTLSWNYSYSSAIGSANTDACAANSTCQDSAYVDVVDPYGNRTRNTLSTRADETEGQLRRIETYSGSNTLIRQVDYQYAPKDLGPYPSRLGTSYTANLTPSPLLYLTPLRSTVITQDGVTFSSMVSSFNTLAHPLSVHKWSSLGYSRNDVTDYYDNTTHWVLGQVKRHYNVESGLADVRNEYDPYTDLPVQTYAFEKLKATMTYYTDGTLATSKDGNNNTTTFSNWKRGIPQTIQYADGTSISAAVDDNGWVRSLTDENGYVTGYGYDTMGRVAGIVYPNETNLNYNTTTITFLQSTSAAYGLPAGHWEQITQTGNHKKVVYFDGLWRPVAEQEEDVGASSTTLHWLAKRYDSDEHLIFQSYPINPYVSGWKNFTDALAGINTTYDVLGRVTQVKQDSELGVLTTTTNYLTGFQVRTTNPRSYPTTTGYQVYDQPSYDQLAWSAQPENKDVTIARNYFGMPTSITQSDHANSAVSVTRSYVYNANMELCKTIEPEVGSTVMSYDPAGNLAWSAAGGIYPSTTSCNTTEAYSSGRRADRSYDPRNHVLSLAFPDGRGNQSWTYTPDGLVNTSTVDNDGPSQGTVNQVYTYNHRRLLAGESTSQPGWYTMGIGYGYDQNGNLSTQQYPNNLTVSYSPNALGQATSVASTTGKIYASGVSYYPNGGVSQFTYGNGIVHTMAQNARQLPSRSTGPPSLS
ncbi:RHS Repeat [Lysobacter silvestris]|uniref:RHS Repeat n=2 Tax=Solilutibacter silvestris TaxID=1645665 RepID=A0A2K1Q482_9GAMM|nr:RHS Repeat [Lysobacter silvestris]